MEDAFRYSIPGYSESVLTKKKRDGRVFLGMFPTQGAVIMNSRDHVPGTEEPKRHRRRRNGSEKLSEAEKAYRRQVRKAHRLEVRAAGHQALVAPPLKRKSNRRRKAKASLSVNAASVRLARPQSDTIRDRRRCGYARYALRQLSRNRCPKHIPKWWMLEGELLRILNMAR